MRSEKGDGPKSQKDLVAVGTALASGPPHRSVREVLLHTAPTSGSFDGQPLVGIRMQCSRGRCVANQPCHVLPTFAAEFLTAPSQNAKPDAAHLAAKPVQTRAVSRYRMIVEPTPTTDRSHSPISVTVLCMCLLSCALISNSFARMRLAIDCRLIVNAPFRVFPQ